MRSIVLLVVAVSGTLFCSCNTMIGLGRDMRIGGEGLENSANKATGGGASDEASGAPVY